MQITPILNHTAQVMTDEEVQELGSAIERIVEVAHRFGLNFFEMRYEICPADIIYTFGAYAMPTRFSHWSFGKTFHQMKTQYDYGMAKIYELVINSDPCYAFLLDTNSLIQNKLIAAHVLAHSDFFKSNCRFRDTNRQMVASMAAFANRVLHYEQDLGRGKVERFLDAVMSIYEHVDPIPRRDVGKVEARSARKLPQSGPYSDLWALDRSEQSRVSEEDATNRPEPTRDLLLYLLERAPDLDEWQRDILSSLRNEMLYFRPQMETKIMNEGWASFWHVRIMRELDLAPAESVEFARMHAAVLAPSRFHLNPYHLGFYMFEDIERRYGLERAFEVRETDTDVSFIRNYLTKELCERLDLYLYSKQGDEWRITATGWEKVRDGIIQQIGNCGFPYIYAEEHDYLRRGELYLRHAFEGVELDSPYVKRTLTHVYRIWERPVHLETVEDGVKILYSNSGGETERRVLSQ